MKTLWEKERILLTLSHSVFYSVKERNHHFSNVSFDVKKCFQFGQALDFSKLTEFADDNFEFDKICRTEIIVEKGEIAT